MYWGVVAHRWREGPEWFPREGTAVLLAMSGSPHTTAFARWLAHYPDRCYALTMVTMVSEVLLPFLLLVTPITSKLSARLRVVVVLILTSMHWGFRLGLILTNFTAINMVANSIFLPSILFPDFSKLQTIEAREDLAHVADVTEMIAHEQVSGEKLRRRKPATSPEKDVEPSKAILGEKADDVSGGEKEEETIIEEEEEEFVPTRLHLPRWLHLFCSFLTFYMCYQFVAIDLELIPSVDNGDFGQGIRFYQCESLSLSLSPCDLTKEHL